MSNQENKKLNAKIITELGLLIALQVILTRFMSIHTPIVRIGFGFLPLALTSILYGPWIGGIAAAIADLIGFILFPTGTYFPGFTLTAFLTGFTYGILLHNKPKSHKRLFISVLIVCILLNLGLDTLWLSILMGKGYIALLPTRIIKTIIMIPVQFITISLVLDRFLFKIKSFIIAR
ncbi:folate family ECF transporter S component [Tepidibacter hydrothermalis]|uniref:Folate family ECF transporter S component n=1 Tax=Tepidibacter hydrothermalis TaxID=3036126 RepID=A0ABY8EJ91_9FIRM|nr:folate family ECF transporter S component [Tepidibacter hydrothermalis]WFD11839.1 folate family ECF transporter S component [Tepidibacter hydrothermalis]